MDEHLKTDREIDRVRAYIRAVGATRVAAETGVSRRTLHYILIGQDWPSYETVNKIMDAIEGVTVGVDEKSAVMASNAATGAME
jgi:DNA-binding phage protein